MIRGILFDINGTLSEIWTDETDKDVYRTVSAFLSYRGVLVDPEVLHGLYFKLCKQQLDDSKELYPEFDVCRLFEKVIQQYAVGDAAKMKKDELKDLSKTTAQVFRSASRRELKLYPNVRKTLDVLKKRYRLAAVSDGQTVWGYPELNAVGLTEYFSPVIVSGDYGYRKPDPRLFKKALSKTGLDPDEAVFVGNDMYRDVYGAQTVGIKVVFYHSNQGDQTHEGTTPDAVITDFADLPAVIKKLEKTK